MAKKKVEEKINLDSILFKCRDILRKARNSGSVFEKRDMMLTLVFLRFIGEKFEDGVENLRQNLIREGLDPDDEAIKAAFLDDPTFTDGTYNLPMDARWYIGVQYRGMISCRLSPDSCKSLFPVYFLLFYPVGG